ncbi:kelch 41 [Brachionus plicatilis]|uniref:Kelch 41 n=1 Tax=Brachionus plicatilis TaxID=10195 RepID=A0A3M7R4Q5_BRAPC|nr:kelch 41 [Brachionus plicatilis]
MDSARRKRECKKHEKRSNDVLRSCETCGRNFLLCDICRPAKNLDAPSSICIKCAPSYKTLKIILDKKDAEIFDLQHKLNRIDSDIRTNEDLKKQIANLRRQNDELKAQIANLKERNEYLSKTNEKIQVKCDKMTDDFKAKYEFIRDMKNLLKNQNYADCFLNVNEIRYPAHRCIISARSPVLKNLVDLVSTMSPTPLPLPLPPVQTKTDKSRIRKDKFSKLDESTVFNNHNSKTHSENSSNVIELKEVDPNIMPFIINFIYSGETESINEKNVQSIMKAADVLELNGLRTSCLVFMEGQLNRLTCIPILIEAFELNHERLKKKCLNFIQKENIDLTSSPQWTEFKNENPKLALNMYERYVKERSLLSAHSKAKNEESNEKANLSTRSNQLNPIKNPHPPQWNNNSHGTIFSNKATNNGKKKLTVDR